MQAEGGGSREDRNHARGEQTESRQGADRGANRGTDREQTNPPVEVAAHIDADSSSLSP